MRVAFFVLAAVAVAVAASPALAKITTEEDALRFIADNADTLPIELVQNPSLDLLKQVLTPKYMSLSVGDEYIYDNVLISDLAAINAQRELENPRERGHAFVGGNGNGLNPAEIWNLGKDLWNAVLDNQPSVNLTTTWAGAVPVGIGAGNWTDLTGWTPYESAMYKWEFKGVFGIRLTEFEWVWSSKAKGSISGVGNYVVEAGAAPKKVYAYLSEHIDVTVKAMSPLNYGTTAQPIAGIDLVVTENSHGHFESTTVSCHVTMRGDSKLSVVTCDST